MTKVQTSPTTPSVQEESAKHLESPTSFPREAMTLDRATAALNDHLRPELKAAISARFGFDAPSLSTPAQRQSEGLDMKNIISGVRTEGPAESQDVTAGIRALMRRAKPSDN